MAQYQVNRYNIVALAFEQVSCVQVIDRTPSRQTQQTRYLITKKSITKICF